MTLVQIFNILAPLSYSLGRSLSQVTGLVRAAQQRVWMTEAEQCQGVKIEFCAFSSYDGVRCSSEPV